MAISLLAPGGRPSGLAALLALLLVSPAAACTTNPDAIFDVCDPWFVAAMVMLGVLVVLIAIRLCMQYVSCEATDDAQDKAGLATNEVKVDVPSGLEPTASRKRAATPVVPVVVPVKAPQAPQAPAAPAASAAPAAVEDAAFRGTNRPKREGEVYRGTAKTVQGFRL